MSETGVSDESVDRSELKRSMEESTTRAGTVSAAFAMAVALGLPWMRWPKVSDGEDDRLLFDLWRTFTSRYESQDVTIMRVAAFSAVAATIICLVGAWRRWSPTDVVLAPRIAILTLIAAIGYVEFGTSYIWSDAGVYVALVIQVGLCLLWTSASRRCRRD